MATVNRQNNLFAAEDWKIAYKVFSQVDFQAYDFDSIRTALVEYVRTNFPENFNDYTESSEFIAILELLAFLSTSIAFRMDINTRENFLETAERRDSVFKLARMLGYNPKRNIPASGLMKLSAVTTTESLVDSQGNQLSNQKVFWDDANNPDSYEQFITILNSAMSSTNRFTAPVKTGKIANINTEKYLINSVIGSPIAHSFTINANGVNRQCEIVNGDFDDGKFFYEKYPDPLNDFGIFYRNDGQGIASNNTGFFLLFKQGQLQFQDFDFTTSVVSRVQDLNIQNINETDIFVQEITTGGTVLNQWTKIPNTVGQTLNYNNQELGTRNMYACENLNNDGIRIRFPDGNFGNIPNGIFRVWYRQSDAEIYTIQPDDATNLSVNIPYENGAGEQHTLTLSFGLRSAVNNSLPAESLANIKANAPQTYYTQNRMVSAQDYQVFPSSQSANINKLKATNRTHAGHSRYIDITDPTGTFQSIESYAEDGVIYADISNSSEDFTINENNTATEVVNSVLPLYLKKQNLNNFVYNTFRKSVISTTPATFDTSGRTINWNTLPVKTQNTTGYLTETTLVSGVTTTSVLINNTAETSMFKENNFIKFVDPNNIADYKWVRITKIDNNGQLSSGLSTSTGPISLSSTVENGYKANEIIATLRKTFTATEQTTIINEINNKRNFGIGYDPSADEYYIVQNQNLSLPNNGVLPEFSYANAKDTSGTNADASYLIHFKFNAISTNSYSYNVSVRGLDYVIQSKEDLKFYNVKSVKITDNTTKAVRDKITLNTLNTKPGVTEVFKWYDNDNDNLGEAWESQETGQRYTPLSTLPNIPLRSRNYFWYDIDLEWQSNFGLLRGGDSAANVVANNRFVDEATVNLNTYFEDNSTFENRSNVTIANVSGRIEHFPANIVINFDNTTFGYNLFDSDGNVNFKQENIGTGAVEFYRGNSTIFSYGTNGNTANVSASGKLVLSNANATAQTGTLTYTGLQTATGFLHAADSSTNFSVDKLNVIYLNDKEKLDKDIVWTISDTFKESDGYCDPRKVKVAPIDSDEDLVPDDPLQYDDFVSPQSLVFFEYYTDFDGYTYDRPVSGVFLDYRGETSIDLSNTDFLSPSSYLNQTAWNTVGYLIVDTLAIAESLNNTETRYNGLVIYVTENKKVYQMQASSTAPATITLNESSDYIVREGRASTQNTAILDPQNVILKWNHTAPNDVRIDPSISNVVEMTVLTQTYYNEILKYINVPGTPYPVTPTSEELSNEFTKLNEFKSASDTLVFRSSKFKLLFGSDAEEAFQAKFKIVKLPGTNLSDNEIKSGVIRLFNQYFEADNWEFGETFYFTELSSFIHQNLGNAIGSILILPKNTAGNFGDLFQVKADPNELFISTATVNDISIVEKITSQTLRTDR